MYLRQRGLRANGRNRLGHHWRDASFNSNGRSRGGEAASSRALGFFLENQEGCPPPPGPPRHTWHAGGRVRSWGSGAHLPQPRPLGPWGPSEGGQAPGQRGVVQSGGWAAVSGPVTSARSEGRASDRARPEGRRCAVTPSSSTQHGHSATSFQHWRGLAGAAVSLPRASSSGGHVAGRGSDDKATRSARVWGGW